MAAAMKTHARDYDVAGIISRSPWFEGLPDELRDILSVAAVIGKSFDARDLETLAGDKGDVDDAVDRATCAKGPSQ